MNTTNNQVMREDIEDLLPWHAAGTLNRRDAQRVEDALATDRELARRFELVREELGETIRLNETLGAPSARAMQQLFAKIDAEPARTPKVSFNLGAWLTDFVTSFRPRTLAYGAMAAALAIVLQAGLLAGMFVKDGGTGFTTASAPDNAKGAFVAVRFNPQASAADITKFLTDNKASLVSGPAAGGLSEDQLSTVVKNISANPVIGFAAKAN